MTIKYSVIEIFTSEEAGKGDGPIHEKIVRYVRGRKIAARSIVTRGVGGCYENGEISSQNILSLSYNMPVKIDIVLPTAELDAVLPDLEQLVTEGLVGVRGLEVSLCRTRKYFVPRNIRVLDIMNSPVTTVGEDTPVVETAKILLGSHFTGLPVVDEENRPLGIVTQGDLIYRAGMPLRIGLLADSGRENIEKTLETMAGKRTGDIMTRDVVVIEGERWLTDAAGMMLDRKVKRLPVVDKEGRLSGILSRVDIFRTITKESPDWDMLKKNSVLVKNMQSVSDIMRRDSRTISPETSVEEIIKVIDADDIQRVSVVDKDGRFLGLISDRDLISAFSGHGWGIRRFLSRLIPFQESAGEDRYLQGRLKEMKASDVMKTHIMTVPEDAPLSEAVRIMVEGRLKRLPVVGNDGLFRGMISRDGLLRTGFESTRAYSRR